VRLRGNGTEVTIAITPRESHEHRDQASIARDGDVAIVTLRSLATKKDAADIDHALAAARAAKALVIDLRGNHGGVDQVGSRVVAGLAEGTAVLATYRVLVTPATVAAYKKWAHLVAEPDGFSPPQRFEVQAQASGKGFHGPIAIVVDAGCASTCEVVAGALRGVLHASVVGETTAGSSGAPVSVELPVAHGTINIPAWDLISADGHAIEDEGVAPDVEAIATPDALAAGIDLPLRTAIDAVKH